MTDESGPDVKISMLSSWKGRLFVSSDGRKSSSMGEKRESSSSFSSGSNSFPRKCESCSFLVFTGEIEDIEMSSVVQVDGVVGIDGFLRIDCMGGVPVCFGVDTGGNNTFGRGWIGRFLACDGKPGGGEIVFVNGDRSFDMFVSCFWNGDGSVVWMVEKGFFS